MDYWWTGNPEEDLWIEITHSWDRTDFLENVGGLGPDRLNQAGTALIPHIHTDDIVIHYDIDRMAIIGVTQAKASDYEIDEDDEWDDEDWREESEPAVTLNYFTPCPDPISLEEMRQRSISILDLLNTLGKQYGRQPLYYPWMPHGESIEMSRSCVAKFPRSALHILPELVPVLEALEARRDEDDDDPPNTPQWQQLTRDAVLAAIAECDEVGRDAFLGQYGFHRSRVYVLAHEGDEYDSKAVAGVAFKYVPEVNRALRPDELSGGLSGAAGWLRRLGFWVYDLNAAEQGEDAP